MAVNLLNWGFKLPLGYPQCGEPDGFSTFRLGLFGLDKLNNIDAAVATLEKALDQVLA